MVLCFVKSCTAYYNLEAKFCDLMTASASLFVGFVDIDIGLFVLLAVGLFKNLSVVIQKNCHISILQWHLRLWVPHWHPKSVKRLLTECPGCPLSPLGASWHLRGTLCSDSVFMSLYSLADQLPRIESTRLRKYVLVGVH